MGRFDFGPGIDLDTELRQVATKLTYAEPAAMLLSLSPEMFENGVARARRYQAEIADASGLPTFTTTDPLTAAAVLASKCRSRLLGAVSVTSPGPVGRGPDRALIVDREASEDAEVPVTSRRDDPAFVDWVRRRKRMGASGADTRAFADALIGSAARVWATLEPFRDAPPVLQIRRRDAPDLEDHEWWQRIFPDAESVTIEGADRAIPGLDAGLVGELMAGFITGTSVTTPLDRQLMAVLFTDLVDSTPTAAATGDTVWRATLDRYETTVTRTVERHHGTVIKHTGDGALATFQSASQAIDAALELRRSTQDLGLEGRTGIHVGEVEQRSDDIGGIAVHLAARVMGQAEPGSILVTPTVAQSSLGGRHTFVQRGLHELKGIDEPWELLAVELHNP